MAQLISGFWVSEGWKGYISQKSEFCSSLSSRWYLEVTSLSSYFKSIDWFFSTLIEKIPEVKTNSTFKTSNELTGER